jgi:hypothetical protein
MQAQYFANIREGVDVVDVDGDKVGTVNKIFQPAQVPSTAATRAEPAGRPILKVDTGFLGLARTCTFRRARSAT